MPGMNPAMPTTRNTAPTAAEAICTGVRAVVVREPLAAPAVLAVMILSSTSSASATWVRCDASRSVRTVREDRFHGPLTPAADGRHGTNDHGFPTPALRHRTPVAGPARRVDRARN